jgi:hypothetical protein
MHFRPVSRSVDGDDLSFRIDEPCHLSAVRDPLLHLGLKLGEVVRLRTEFNEEVGANRRKTVLVCFTESIPTDGLNPCGVGAAHRAVGQRKAGAGVEDVAASVILRPDIERTDNGRVPSPGAVSCGRHDKNLPIHLAFDAGDVIRSTEAHQVFIAHWAFGPEAKGRSHSRQGGVHGEKFTK